MARSRTWDVEELKRRYADLTQSVPSIAQELGISTRTLYDYVRDLGLPRRGYGPGLRLAYSEGRAVPRRGGGFTLRDILRCQGCGHTWRRGEDKAWVDCPACGKGTLAKVLTSEAKEAAKVSRKETRLKALQIVGRGCVACEWCGCDALELLDINHINGDGKEDRKRYSSSDRFTRAIVSGERSSDDLNLLCKWCNLKHYQELKHGPLPVTISWHREGRQNLYEKTA